MIQRILRAVAWRTLWRTQILVFHAGPLAEAQPIPPDLTLLRIGRAAPNQLLAEAAMLAAGEPAGLTPRRFADNDEFFAWRLAGQIVAFGWVTCNDRMIGRDLVPARPGRAFLYNFYTSTKFRGRGLYPLLLLAVRSALTQEQINDVIIDVNARNKASLHGVAKAGFRCVGRTASLTLFQKWDFPLQKVTLDDISPILKQ